MKIVINKCYGGFGLSPQAVKMLAKMEGKSCYFFTHDPKSNKHIPVKIKDIKCLFWNAFTVPNPDEVARPQGEDWSKLSLEERQASNQKWKDITLETRPENRACPKLVQVVEKLGKKASSEMADLKVVKIPDGVEYEITEYDGSEHIAEKHRTWY